MAVSNKKSTANETTVRHLWLAGLGVVAVTRREAIATAGRVLDGVGELKQRVERGAADAQANIRHGIDGVRRQVEPKLAKIRVAQFSAEVESRLAPVLVKLGLEPSVKAQRNTRKPAREEDRASYDGAPAGQGRQPVARKTHR